MIVKHVVGQRLAITILTGLFMTGCDGTANSAEEAAREPVVRPVRLMEIAASSDSRILSFPGSVGAAQTSELSFQVPGKIAEIPVREGQIIDQGTPVARLDTTDYELALREAEVRLAQLDKELARYERLSAEGHVSASNLDETEAQRDLAAVAVDKARQNLEYTRLEAPFDAVVAERLVDPFTNINAATPVVLLQDISSLDIEISVPEIVFARVRKEDVRKMTATFPAEPDQRFPLTMKEYSTDPDPSTRTYDVTLSMARPDQVNILPGMSASVEVEIARPEGDVITVPMGAVTSESEGEFHVWVYDADAGTVSKRAVELGGVNADQAEIISGLEPGETIAAAGAGFLSDNMRVRPAEAL